MNKMIRFSLLLLFGAGFSLQAQQTFPVNGAPDPRHSTYAFINASIFTDYRTVQDSVSMLIRDGIILDIGKNINVPAFANVYDLKGKTIYPGLIDIFSDYGLPEVKKNSKDTEGPVFLNPEKTAVNWNQAIRADYDAAKNFNVDPKKAEEWRKLGFGSVQSVNKDGIVRGTSVFVHLGDKSPHDMIIREQAAAHYSFNKGSSAQDYPSSLMGAIALLRQTYYDALWYRSGGYKKEINLSLDAFNKIQNLPQVFEAGDKQNILRAATIAREFGATYIIKGGGNEYERIQELKAVTKPMIIPLNFPDAYDLNDPYEAINISVADMKHWELAPSNPALLEKAGIEFALTTSDLKNKNDFFKNLRKAIEMGLSEEQALKALTLAPATALGLEDRIGSLKKGMLANFIVCTGSVFSKENLILENWIKGERYLVNTVPAEDLRGNYSLLIGNKEAIRLEVGGERYQPEVKIHEDTLTTKATFVRNGNLMTLVFELKKSEPKGTYRLSGVVSEKNYNFWSGEAVLPSGEWRSWSVRLDSAYRIVNKPDTATKKQTVPGQVWYPNMAYGTTEIPSPSNVLFRNATVWTNEKDGILQNYDVLIRNGKIEELGRNIKAPENVRMVDATGKHLTSGIIDEHSHIAVSGSVNEGTQASSAEVRIGDVVDADDVNIYRQLAGGVTSSHLLHGSANPIGGQTQLIKLRWGKSAEELKFAGWPGFIKFALGENVKQSHWGDKQVVRFPQTRMGVEQVYVDYFTRSKEYREQQKKFNAMSSAMKLAGIPVRRDLELDALVEILEARRFITCHSYEQSEINMLMHVGDSLGFKVNTFTHILEGYKLADKMKKHGVLGASTFSDWWAYKFEVYEAIPYNGAIMQKMGLTVSYNSDDAEMARRLNQEAAKAVMYGGLSEEEAWKFVTLNPAKMLHVDDRVGSIRKGKDADVVLWSGNPLSIASKAEQTYVDGVLYFDLQKDQDLRKQMAAEKARITEKMNESKNKGENTQKPSLKIHLLKHCMDETEHHMH